MRMYGHAMPPHHITSLFEGTSTSYTILRPTGIYGPGDDFAIFELMNMVNQGFFFFIPGKGNAMLMFTHVEDVSQGITKAVIDPHHLAANNTYNICPNDPLPYSGWICTLNSLFGRVQPFISLPMPVVKLVTLILSPVMNIGKRRIFMYNTKTVERMSYHRWAIILFCLCFFFFFFFCRYYVPI
eukprot:TRINITY_DN8436_c0_g1_i4.p2 TRINITY_DN8436_c0_g1~~TRINITY_DN8436_c0_g1_i4.p2  ORF type:complete len:184 (+),score=35.24 TRINITY_DN8436_c0_g1_i4:520-1071(+)